MKLSKNFTLEELTVTSTDLPNVPNQEQIDNLQRLVVNVLQPLRDLYGKPIKVNSGFRSADVNNAVGGSPTSDHCLGCAADLDCEDNKLLFELISGNLPFKQLIDEKDFSWVHVSFVEGKNKRQVLKLS